MALVFIPLPPISTSVRLDAQVPVVERKRAWVRLSAHALRVPVVGVIAAVAIDPARAAPTINAATTLTFNLIFLIPVILPLLPESSL
jgi:hypothetical protein